jgi:predicted house-cleaning NTP pyrophosphatase (Maf/HAM1 superfamily)
MTETPKPTPGQVAKVVSFGEIGTAGHTGPDLEICGRKIVSVIHMTPYSNTVLGKLADEINAALAPLLAKAASMAEENKRLKEAANKLNQAVTALAVYGMEHPEDTETRDLVRVAVKLHSEALQPAPVEGEGK